MRRTREEAQHTRLLIMQKGLEAFAEQGVSSCSLTEIARSVGCTRGAIYWHFKHKWDLFEAICEHYSRPLKSLSEACLSDDEHDPLGKLRLLLVQMLISIEQDQGFCLVMIMFMRESSGLALGGAPEPVSSFIREQHDRRLVMLKNAIQRGQLPASLDLEFASSFIKAVMDGFITSWLQRSESFSLSGNAEILVGTLIANLQSLKGFPNNTDHDVEYL
ncbi:TetR family transcriptional regulator [Marinobacterium sedimentorum]|uniref:TetR family transcriptional regulator n=1 Tax=Marinobacterium sedimentorum TaxID=2927804 RepID=UPI0020C5EF33|nr:TetR family transcriptional regulator [Marinobacterium sedimentorum]MCP8689539.1 TetR family transcriptional regulator [Marinobacterium sedimentorum]